jgi:hypothetical protein
MNQRHQSEDAFHGGPAVSSNMLTVVCVVAVDVGSPLHGSVKKYLILSESK